MEYDQGLARQYIEQYEQQKAVDQENAKNALLQEWGNAYEQRIHFGNVAINEGTGGDMGLQDRITEKFGDDPDFIKLVSNLGAKFTERGAIHAENVPTPGDLAMQIADEMAKPSYGKDYARHGYTKKQHDNQVRLVQSLFEKQATQRR